MEAWVPVRDAMMEAWVLGRIGGPKRRREGRGRGKRLPTNPAFVPLCPFHLMLCCKLATNPISCTNCNETINVLGPTLGQLM